ncbi:MAG: 3-methyl-2-oxobutanoate hydroxymethyltransferase [Candidatus Omnitrophica bacterium]|nr:3-methyl-2-oxobutanoate hydroxymethyltransferase [Candidatus Omnitrophota bacterium]
MKPEKITIRSLQEKKINKKKITMLTAYDYPMARLVDDAGIDIILVGDSLGMVVLGYDSTLPVTMEDMIRHTQAVRRGTKHALLVGDMPYKSYDTKEAAIANAKRFMEEAGCDAVKLEGGTESLEAAEIILNSGIPVMGHLGLTPQSIEKLGGFKVQGKTAEAAKAIIEDSKKLEKVGCFSIVLECVPSAIAKIITAEVKVPTIGIGAGVDCDGQVLVTNDMVGLFDRFVPKFVKQYIKLAPQILEGLLAYKKEVEDGKFPAEEHAFTIKQEELKKI